MLMLAIMYSLLLEVIDVGAANQHLLLLAFHLTQGVESLELKARLADRIC